MNHPETFGVSIETSSDFCVTAVLASVGASIDLNYEKQKQTSPAARMLPHNNRFPPT
jgi:hypothetical protein